MFVNVQHPGEDGSLAASTSAWQYKPDRRKFDPPPSLRDHRDHAYQWWRDRGLRCSARKTIHNSARTTSTSCSAGGFLVGDNLPSRHAVDPGHPAISRHCRLAAQKMLADQSGRQASEVVMGNACYWTLSRPATDGESAAPSAASSASAADLHVVALCAASSCGTESCSAITRAYCCLMAARRGSSWLGAAGRLTFSMRNRSNPAFGSFTPPT